MAIINKKSTFLILALLFALLTIPIVGNKFEGFVKDLIKVGNSLKTSKDSYDDAMSKLTKGKGNIVKKIENLKQLGAKTKKSLPQNIIERASEDEDN